MISLRKNFYFARAPFLSLVALVLLVGCNSSSCKVEPPEWPKPITTEAGTSASVQTADQLVVYLDTSASMAGYVSPNGKDAFAAAADGQTVFSHLLLELRHVVTTLSPSVNVVFRKVANDVGQPSFNDLELSQAAINRGIYNGGETNLAGAVKKFSEPLTTSTEAKQPPIPRFHILVTDGVQSTKGQRTDTSCDKGSDFVCVKKQIITLLEAGWHGAVLGVKSEFNGTVYSEIQSGLKLQYPSTPKDVNTYRPFYLYLFSPDRAGLDNLIASLKSRLLPLLENREAIREYPLTLALTKGAAKGDIKLHDKAKEYLESKILKGKDGEPLRFEVLVDLDTQRPNVGMQGFFMNVDLPWTDHAQDAGTHESMLRLLKWELTPVTDEKHPEKSEYRYPELKLIRSETNEQGQLEFSAGWPPRTGTPAWRMYRLIARLNTDKDAPPWVADWSSDVDTKREHATRTLNLKDSLAKLWKNQTMEKSIIAEYHILVGKN